jgi:hypothetical protein
LTDSRTVWAPWVAQLPPPPAQAPPATAVLPLPTPAPAELLALLAQAPPATPTPPLVEPPAAPAEALAEPVRPPKRGAALTSWRARHPLSTCGGQAGAASVARSGSWRESDGLAPLLEALVPELAVLRGGEAVAAGRKWLLTALKGSRNRCACAGDLNRWSTRSRFRTGRCEFSARLFRPLWRRCSVCGSIRLSAGGELASLSVTTTRGWAPHPSSTWRRKASAALRLRRAWTRMSSTTPSSSTARHRQCLRPLRLSCTSSTCHLSPGRGRRRFRPAANMGPNLRHHNRIVS